MNANNIRRRLSKRVIDRLGVDTVFLRENQTQTKDDYGEPTVTPWPTDSFPIRVVIDKEKMQEESSDVGGIGDQKHERVYFYCKGDIDIRDGDYLVYPAGSKHQWLVEMCEPMVINGIVLIIEVKAIRDARY